jgi:hypothetical protein
MPLPREDVDATTPKFLRDKYAVVGETAYTRGSNMTTRALATIAVHSAMLDAGLKASEIDGMLSYQSNDSVFSPFVAGDLGIRLNFYMDVFGGGSSTEALIGIAIGVIEAGMCKAVVIFRSMNGFSQVRIGGTGVRAAAPLVSRKSVRICERAVAHQPPVAGHYAKDILWPNSGLGPEDIDLTGSYDAFTFTPCCNSRTTASARRARAVTMSRTAPSCSAEKGRTTHRAAISVRATPTASPW